MAAADDVKNYQTGETGNPASPFSIPWLSRIRARKVLSDNVHKEPFTRVWANVKAVASCMQQDKLTAIADAVGWRRVNTDGITPGVTDFGDNALIQWEYFKLTADPKILAQAVANAKTIAPWPKEFFDGVADFEQGT